MTQQEALTILKTGANIFLTGEPGSGKTYTINQYINYLRAARVSLAVTASTGIAATHLNGTTIHSWSAIGLKHELSAEDLAFLKLNKKLIERVTKTKVLIIDEISMIDANVLDTVDLVCRTLRQNDLPFGGLQIVFVGDFFQLPPINRGGLFPGFAFEAQSWHQAKPVVCYLTEQHRQSDKVFLSLLKALRTGQITSKHQSCLDQRLAAETALPHKHQNITKLFPHNENVDKINSLELAKLSGDLISYEMVTKGRAIFVDQLIKSCLSPEILELKIGAVVMFTKNHQHGLFVNGTLGKVIDFADDGWPIVRTNSGQEIAAEPLEWSLEEGDKVIATIRQVPLRLAWAITVHKSQGMSLDAAFMDLRRSFVPGQGYVALSRVRALKNLYLAGYNQVTLQVDQRIIKIDQLFQEDSAYIEKYLHSLTDEDLLERYDDFLARSGGYL